MKFCTNCGSKLDDGSTVCSSCGEQVQPAEKMNSFDNVANDSSNDTASAFTGSEFYNNTEEKKETTDWTSSNNFDDKVEETVDEAIQGKEDFESSLNSGSDSFDSYKPSDYTSASEDSSSVNSPYSSKDSYGDSSYGKNDSNQSGAYSPSNASNTYGQSSYSNNSNTYGGSTNQNPYSSSTSASPYGQTQSTSQTNTPQNQNNSMNMGNSNTGFQNNPKYQNQGQYSSQYQNNQGANRPNYQGGQTNYQPAGQKEPLDTMSLISMIAGIISLLSCCLWPLSLITGIAAIVLGVMGMKKAPQSKGFAIAGIICGGIGVFLALISIIMLIIGKSINWSDFANSSRY